MLDLASGQVLTKSAYLPADLHADHHAVEPTKSQLPGFTYFYPSNPAVCIPKSVVQVFPRTIIIAGIIVWTVKQK